MNGISATRAATVRAAMLVTSSTYVTYALGLVIGAIIARSLGPDLYGRYAFLVWLCGLLVIIVNNGLNTSGIRFVAQHLGRGSADISRRIHGWLLRRHYASLVLGCVGFVIVAMILRPSQWSDALPTFIVVVVISVAFRSKYLFDISIAKGYGAFHVEAYSTFVVSVLTFAGAATLAWLHAGLPSYLILFAASSTGLWVYAELALRRASLRPSNEALPAEVHKEVTQHLIWTIVLIGFASFGNRTIETFALNATSGSADVGFFAIANTLTRGGVDLLTVGLSTVLMPSMGRAFGEGGERQVHGIFVEALRFFVFFGLLLAGLGALWANLSIRLLYGAPYAPVVPILQVMTIIGGLTLSEAALGSLLATTGNQKTWAKASAAQLALSAVLAPILVVQFGLAGAVTSLAISRLATFLFLTISTVRKQHIRLPKAALVRQFIAAACAVAVGVGIEWLAPGNLGQIAAGILFLVFFLGGTILLRSWSGPQVELVRHACERLPVLRGLVPTIDVWRERFTETARV